MKRSELEKHIENTLNANGYGSDTVNAEEMASIILFELDEIGMKPPPITKTVYTGSTTSLVYTPPTTSTIYEWEPEE